MAPQPYGYGWKFVVSCGTETAGEDCTDLYGPGSTCAAENQIVNMALRDFTTDTDGVDGWKPCTRQNVFEVRAISHAAKTVLWLGFIVEILTVLYLWFLGCCANDLPDEYRVALRCQTGLCLVEACRKHNTDSLPNLVGHPFVVTLTNDIISGVISPMVAMWGCNVVSLPFLSVVSWCTKVSRFYIYENLSRCFKEGSSMCQNVKGVKGDSSSGVSV